MILVKATPAEWSNYSEAAHSVVFNEYRPADMDRIDFALIAEADLVPQLYMTCREFDKETVYISSGGAFPVCKGTPNSWQGFMLMLDYLKANYKRCTLLTVNDNFPMLKFALKAGFKTIGIRFFNGYVLLEQYLEFT